MRIVDLSFPIRPHFRWKAVPELVASHAQGHPLQSTVITLSCHAYTHVDAPLHFLPAIRPAQQWLQWRPRRRPCRQAVPASAGSVRPRARVPPGSRQGDAPSTR